MSPVFCVCLCLGIAACCGIVLMWLISRSQP